jgi:hypothetical protein
LCYTQHRLLTRSSSRLHIRGKPSMSEQHLPYSLLYTQGRNILRRTHFVFCWYNLRRKHSYVQLKVQLDVHVFIRILYSSLFFSSTCFGCYLHPSSGAHKLQCTGIGVCNSFCMLISLNLTVLKVWGCPNQYLLQSINIPKSLHTPMAVRCNLCAPEDGCK